MILLHVEFILYTELLEVMLKSTIIRYGTSVQIIKRYNKTRIRHIFHDLC